MATVTAVNVLFNSWTGCRGVGDIALDNDWEEVRYTHFQPRLPRILTTDCTPNLVERAYSWVRNVFGEVPPVTVMSVVEIVEWYLLDS